MNIVDSVGSTPLIRLKSFSDNFNLYAKLEYMNPWGSLKDRVAVKIIEDAEEKGLLKEGMHVIEATSGNTGISMAAVCASKNYKCTVILPEFVSTERKILLSLLGADIILTKKADGLVGTVAKSLEMAAEDENIFILDQTQNENNPDSHQATAEEMIKQMLDENIDVLVVASGTGGHLSGIGKYLKEHCGTHIIAVEPKSSAILSGEMSIEEATADHGIIGIGPGFKPKTLDTEVIDEVIVVDEQESYRMAQKIMKKEGILIGASSGAALLAAEKLSEQKRFLGKNIIAVLASSAERYLSTDLAHEARNYVNNLVPQESNLTYINQLLG